MDTGEAGWLSRRVAAVAEGSTAAEGGWQLLKEHITSSIPFSAALFDLDGTLLDSLYVWRRVDEAFFGARGIPVPGDYSRAVAGMSFGETVDYTIARFNLSESHEEVTREWLRLAGEEYARRVQMKPGAREYLRMLRRAGVKLAAVTANKRALFMPTLERCGVDGLFDGILTTGDVEDRNKSDGALFLLAAERLGVAPVDCAVFEDVAQGIIGAKRAGMRAYAVASADSDDGFTALADGAIRAFGDMRRYHDFPENARRCVIYTARCEGDPRAACPPRAGDYVICADAGWRIAERAGVRPDLVVGDFDSSGAPDGLPVERFPVEKDDTDTMLCVKRGLAMGFDDFMIVGGFGGRLDHALGNLQTLNYAARRGAHAEMCDGLGWATVLFGERRRIPARPGKLSVFALDTECRGVSIRGAKYSVTDIDLVNATTLGAGNDFAAGEAEIGVREGALLVLISPEAPRRD